MINHSDALTYSVEKALGDFEGKVDKNKLDALRKKTGELREELQKEKKDFGALKTRSDELQKLLSEASTELYQQAGKAQAQANEAKGNAKNPDDDVMDANFKMGGA